MSQEVKLKTTIDIKTEIKKLPLEKTCEKLDFIGFLLFDAMGDGEVARRATTLPIQE